ncbi:DUF934 domain-containing protein [Cycloclasticus pugetii]|jgi:uncharacterized protein (DUF934 family)|uniref:DUF934 domain-containing protein n=1 Tax=Cycloclasticus pugetii TaxID=34068 RepID=UPI000912722A|nr:DUF934 domain-containing protein [Cycloclasticus pugetii]SHJ24168.1 Uncharacterized conserved protein, DUF934 family [Cycloclasticus pugetii]|tara:strand:+ start:209 stop:661 length:453 start_codon:yes stop_codon:yes gene_type:complete
MTLIKNNEIVQDRWTKLDEEQALQTDYNIIDLAYWNANKDSLIASKGHLGLWVQGDESAEQFADDLQYFELIAIHFPTFVDGRGYSLAKILREKHHYTKEIRAVGDVLPDQALYLTRVGFDTLEFSTKEAGSLALEKLNEFSVFYQAVIN